MVKQYAPQRSTMMDVALFLSPNYWAPMEMIAEDLGVKAEQVRNAVRTLRSRGYQIEVNRGEARVHSEGWADFKHLCETYADEFPNAAFATADN